MLLEKGGMGGTYGACQEATSSKRINRSLQPKLVLAVGGLAVLTILAVVSFMTPFRQPVSLEGIPISLSLPSAVSSRSRFQSLVGFNKQSDFPFAQTADGELPEEEPLSTNQLGMADVTTPDDLPQEDNLGDMPRLDAKGMPKLSAMGDHMKVADSRASQQLAPLTPEEEPKSDDSPIGIASAASILKDSAELDKSQGSDAWESWKAAAKAAGPSIKESITDDVTSFNPFPHQALAEKMEIQDVWDAAQKLAKPAGSLDGDAEETKKSVENAESQANAAAYLAANEAAATDAYDVSIPNPDMMAKSAHKTMSAHQALAAVHKTASLAHTPHFAGAMQGQAKAFNSHNMPVHPHQALGSRVQALAEMYAGGLTREGIISAEHRALADAQRDRKNIQRQELRIAQEKGAEQEAQRIAATLQRRYSLSPVVDHVGAVRKMRKVAQVKPGKGGEAAALHAARKARALAYKLNGGNPIGAAEEEHAEEQSQRLATLLDEESMLRKQREALKRKQSMLRSQQLEGEEGAEAGGDGESAAQEGEEAEGDGTVFDLTRGHGDQRVKANNNFLSDMLAMALGDEKRPMQEVDADEHAGQLPLNHKSKHVSFLNGMNSGIDPLVEKGVYDTRTAAEIYAKKEESEEGEGDSQDGVEGEAEESE